MAAIGLRELRQNASDVIRRVEAGESVVVTVSGRAAARLVPIADRRWRSWGQVAEVFDVAVDPGFVAVIQELRAGTREEPRDPFEGRRSDADRP